MATINLSPFDEKDLLELLDYAAEKKEQDRGLGTNKNNRWDNTNWWLMRIEQIKEVINGKDMTIVSRSSLPVDDFEDSDRVLEKEIL